MELCVLAKVMKVVPVLTVSCFEMPALLVESQFRELNQQESNTTRVLIFSFALAACIDSVPVLRRGCICSLQLQEAIRPSGVKPVSVLLTWNC